MKKTSTVGAVRAHLAWWKTRARQLVLRSVVRAYSVVSAKKPMREGFTVVTVNYHSLPQLKALLAALERYTTEPLDVVVVDNASKDGSRDFLRSHPKVRSILLPCNFGHGLALDLGVLAARTSVVVTFDVDAFPISPEWLPAVAEPLANGAVIAGAHWNRAYVHPCFSALRRSDFVNHRLSFAPVGRYPSAAVPAPGLFMDAGEAVSHVLSLAYGTASLHKIPPTSTRGPQAIGTVFGGVVYHNFYSTHVRGELGAAAAEAWDHAVSRYLKCPS